MKRIAFVLTLAAMTVGAASAQRKSEAKIGKISVDSTKSPQIQPGPGVKLQRDKPRDWLQIDVSFVADSPTKSDFIDSLEIRFFVLPKSALPDHKKLFSSKLTHVDILKDTELHSAVYLSPNALHRIYGKTGAANPRDLMVAIEIHAGGTMIGWDATDGKSAKEKWWRRTDVPKDSTTLRPKHKTPYALFWYDSYAEVRD
jgi:hypothetical protein